MTSLDLPALIALRNVIDEAIEVALVQHQSLPDLMAKVLPEVRARLGATAILFETYGEDLSLQVFASPETAVLPSQAEVFLRTGEDQRESFLLDTDEGLIVAQPVDVAGAWFGRVAMLVPTNAPRVQSREGLTVLAEVLDNHLFAIRAAREKHLVMMRVGNALRHRVLGEGLANAVEILGEVVPLDRMVLVYTAEQGAEQSTLQVRLFEGTRPVVDTLQAMGAESTELRALGHAFLMGESHELLERFGIRGAQEEVLINGITNSVLVGKVVATSKHGSFNTYDRDLIASFAGFIRQRVVDFNKEWRALAHSFRPEDVARLLQSDDYTQAYLSPREAEVAVLYVDISGFTRISEQVLRTPAKVAMFVEKWSERAVDLVWKHGGVFDKMVGDCIIALFGPPFYDTPPEERLAAAIRCGRDIRAMTNAMPDEEAFANLRDANVGVATGVNLAPLFVGQFGPNANFTGFSSGMNNTARLQGCATRDQILVMMEAANRLRPGEFTFGPQGSMTVKNVAEPLRFVALEDGNEQPK
jgi:adenylate cyclase